MKACMLEFVRACKDLRECVGVCQDEQRHSSSWEDVRWGTMGYDAMQGHVSVCRVVQEHARVCKGM